MDTLVLQAQVTMREDGYLAAIDVLGLEAAGSTLEEAQDNLIKSFSLWLEAQEEGEKLEQSLAVAGLPGLEDNTELELHFV